MLIEELEGIAGRGWKKVGKYKSLYEQIIRILEADINNKMKKNFAHLAKKTFKK